MKTPPYQIGDTVSWTSQAGGNTREKTGVVVALADQAGNRSPVQYARQHFPNHRHMFDGLSWSANGVLVEVPGGKTAQARPKLYMPTSSLSRDGKPTKRSSGGRPAVMKNGRRVNVYLTDETLAAATKLGDGNVSEGIRRALAIATQ